MSYQVLARKWRPKNFQELVGQEHVVAVLVNSLLQQRLHHAYLFTGTRGVGKTTIARIFAKSLNCESGITAEPCGKCDTCIDIDSGRFVDLLEIDAASKTKVDDTREILDNVQYAPSRGRYKVYLIDEVHMLSKSSFNALLKTLEEPPEHVKFILATTDPQKLPITVLSRCLQFHLKALTVSQIESKLADILTAESVTTEKGTLTLLAKAARGSMRDSLSLTDQAISQGQGKLEIANIQQMLGGIDQNWIFKILIALVKNDAQELMQLSQEIASYAPNYSRLLADLIQLLHQIAITQVVEQHFLLSPEHEALLLKLCQAISPEHVQLYYQIAVNGRKDLPYASDEQAAFDMVLLRLLAFKPLEHGQVIENKSPTKEVDFDSSELAATQVTTVISNNSAEHINSELVENNAIKDSVIEEIVIEESVTAESIDINSNAAEETTQSSSMPSAHSIPEQETISEAIEVKVEQENALTQEEVKVESFQEIETTDSEQAVQQHDNSDSLAVDSLKEEVSVPIEANVEASVFPPIDESNTITSQSPIEAALATRNMLRSRKKQMETTSKKSDDAASRQSNNQKNEANVTPLNDASKSKAKNIPAIESLPEQPFSAQVIDPAKIRSANQVDKWANMIDTMSLKGRVRQLAIHATIDENSTDDILKLKLDKSTKHLVSDSAHIQLSESISAYLSRTVAVEVEIVEQTVADPYQIQTQINDKRLDYAKDLIINDELIIQFKTTFQAEIDEESIMAR